MAVKWWMLVLSALLVFFACLFIVVDGIRAAGIVESVRSVTLPWFGDTAARQSAVLAGVSLVLSNLISNVPYVLLARDWMGGFTVPEAQWLILALSSTFAGNLTLVGSVANLIVAELARDRAPVGFWAYLRVGLPVTLLTTLLGTAGILAYVAAGLVK